MIRSNHWTNIFHKDLKTKSRTSAIKFHSWETPSKLTRRLSIKAYWSQSWIKLAVFKLSSLRRQPLSWIWGRCRLRGYLTLFNILTDSQISDYLPICKYIYTKRNSIINFVIGLAQQFSEGCPKLSRTMLLCCKIGPLIKTRMRKFLSRQIWSIPQICSQRRN